MSSSYSMGGGGEEEEAAPPPTFAFFAITVRGSLSRNKV
jgi:hypothetical protein